MNFQMEPSGSILFTNDNALRLEKVLKKLYDMCLNNS